MSCGFAFANPQLIQNESEPPQVARRLEITDSMTCVWDTFQGAPGILLISSYATSFILQVCMDERIDLSCQVAFGIARFTICAMVFHDVVGVYSD